jgi:hypothetical protein
VAALLQHHRWRRDGAHWAAVGAPVTLALALLAGEAAVGALAYLVAYALCLDRGAPRARIASVLPYVALVAGWRTLYQHLGYGTVASAFYADPGREPLRFLLAVLERGPMLLFRQWGVRPAEAYPAMDRPDQLWMLALAAVFVGMIGLALAPLLRRDRTARFFGVGMVLAVVPCCATVPQGRLLTFVAIGAAGLVGRFVECLWWRRPRWMPTGPLWRGPAHVLAALLVASAVVLGPLTLRWTLWEVVEFYPDIEQRALSIPEPDCAPGRRVVLVQGGLPVGFFYSDIRRLHGVLPPERLLVLAPDTVVRVTRVDERTLSVRPRDGFLAPSNTGDWHENAARMFETFVRVNERPLALHERVVLDGVTVEVTRLNGAGRPAEATFRFAVPLDDPSLRWFARRGSRYVRYTPPEIGASARLVPTDA